MRNSKINELNVSSFEWGADKCCLKLTEPKIKVKDNWNYGGNQNNLNTLTIDKWD